MSTPKIAFIIPCLNEAKTINNVVTRALTSVPGSKVYVYDNGSTDETVEEAKNAGAIVAFVPERGKGNVVRRMLADVEADVYVLVDGDGTYEIEATAQMISLLLLNKADMVTGCRNIVSNQVDAYRFGHQLGNRLFTSILKTIFHSSCNDVLSGFRVMTKRFVKSFPVFSKGFEIEVELTAHASFLNIKTLDFETKYFDRVNESESKLRTVRDGLKIMRALFKIFRSYSPSRFFGSIAVLSIAAALLSSFTDWNQGDQSSLAGLSTPATFLVIAVLFFTVGVILNAATRQRYEIVRLFYLSEQI
jgi:glycosyltransferase involved in cell wall biosynthesis